MYVLDTLRNSGNDGELSEFRLLCSGALYNGNVVVTDWSKADVCRVLVRDPFILAVTGYPLDRYPQELMLRVRTPFVQEEKAGGTVMSMFYPHDEVVKDIAALLTLFTRRLVTVYRRVSTHLELGSSWFSGQELPVALSDQGPPIVWRHRPAGVLRYPDGSEIVDYSSKPVPLDDAWLERMFRALPHLALARYVLATARLYSEAMQLIEDRPEVAYQLLVAATETIAGAALHDFEPTAAEKIATKQPVAKRAIELGLSSSAANELALLATGGQHWTGRRFREFLARYTDDTVWSADDLFLAPASVLPDKPDFARSVKTVYESRGAFLHAGEGLPLTASIGTAASIPTRAVASILEGKPKLPPVTWFERIVQRACVNCIEGLVTSGSERAV